MRYMGSKARLAKHILPIILANRKDNQLFYDAFTGGGNLIQFVDGDRIGNDINEYVITCLDAASKGWMPNEFYSEDDYQQARLGNFEKHIKGWIGFACSFGGKFFGGYTRSKDSKGNDRDMQGEQYCYALKQFPKLKGVKFTCGDYRDTQLPDNTLIYCDPPYRGTTEYKHGGFNHDAFYQWCCDMVDLGHEVFVSEYNVTHPRFKCVFEKAQKSSVRRADDVVNCERLYEVI